MKMKLLGIFCATFVGLTLVSAASANAGSTLSEIISRRSLEEIEKDGRSVDELKGAIKQGDAEAAAILGDRYFSGRGVERDLEQGFAAYRKAVELGYDVKKENGAQTESKFEELTAASEKGDAQATRELALSYIHGKNVAKNEKKGLELLTKASDLGDAKATFMFVGAYRAGLAIGETVFEKDEEKAFTYALRTVEIGDAKWIRSAAALYFEEKKGVVEKNPAKGIEILEKAVEAGNAEAACDLASRYAQGDGVEQSVEKCREWYLKGIKLGSADAARWLGNRYLTGDFGFKRDVAQGLEYYAKAVEMGDSTAAYRLGWRYAEGSDVAKDEAKAVELYRKAAEQDGARESDAAAYRLGMCYLDGVGVAKDEEKAREWLRKASNAGLGDAGWALIDRLGDFETFTPYYFTKWSDENKRKIFATIQREAKKGNADAAQYLIRFYKYGNVVFDVKKDEAKAAEWESRVAETTKNADLAISAAQFYLKKDGEEAKGLALLTKAFEWGDSYAACELGTCYGRGVGVAQSGAKCLEWYGKAVEMGNADAARWIGNRYFSGDCGVEADFEKGVEWYEKAVEMGDFTAAMRLGNLYLHGRINDFIVETDAAKAVEWLRKALERAVGSEANLKAGFIYSGFQTIEAARYLSEAYDAVGDAERATEWLRRAFEVATVDDYFYVGGQAAAQALGERYLDGRGVERNEAEGLKFFEIANSETSWNELAERYETGRGLEKNAEKATEAREKAQKAKKNFLLF